MLKKAIPYIVAAIPILVVILVNICDRFFARDEHFRKVIQTKLLEDNDA